MLTGGGDDVHLKVWDFHIKKVQRLKVEVGAGLRSLTGFEEDGLDLQANCMKSKSLNNASTNVFTKHVAQYARKVNSIISLSFAKK